MSREIEEIKKEIKINKAFRNDISESIIKQTNATLEVINGLGKVISKLIIKQGEMDQTIDEIKISLNYLKDELEKKY